MGQAHDEITRNLAERLCWQVARRDETRIARRLYRNQVVDGVYRLDEGARLDDFFHFLQKLGVMAMLPETPGAGIDRVMVPFVPYLLLYGLKTLLGIESINALPTLLFSDAVLMQLVGFTTRQLRYGVCQRGAAKRQGERTSRPIRSDTLAKKIVKLNLRDLEVVCNGAIRALAQAGVLAAKVTGMADGTDLETTQRYADCGQVTRKVRIEDKCGRRPELKVTVYGGNVLLLIAAATTIPLAVKGGKLAAQETHWTRALVPQARAHLAGAARLHEVVFDQGFLDGTDRWWLNQHGLLLVIPAQSNMAVTADARAQATAGEGITVGRRVHTVRHGLGKVTRTERLETEVVGITGLTTYDQDRTVEHGRYAHRRAFEANPLNAVVVRHRHGRADGPGGKTLFLTNASVQQPLRPFDDDDNRRLIETCCIKETKQPWDLGHPPQQTERAVRVPVMCTLLRFALATA